jgi:N-formylglutamate amidohydrolase
MPAYEVLRGAETSPVLLHVPHCGVEIPDWTRPHLLLDDAELTAELHALTDYETDVIATLAATRSTVRPWIVLNRVSRFVVDPERFPDEREEMAAVGMAAVYTHGTRGQRIRADDAEHRDALLDAYYAPWAEAVADLVDARLAATGQAVVLDVHSYPTDPLPYELHADGPRPAVCLGTDPVHTPSTLVGAARAAFGRLGDVEVDTPFRGAYVPLRHHGLDPRVSALMVELRRDGHMLDARFAYRPGRLTAARAIAALVDAVTSSASTGPPR